MVAMADRWSVHIKLLGQRVGPSASETTYRCDIYCFFFGAFRLVHTGKSERIMLRLEWRCRVPAPLLVPTPEVLQDVPETPSTFAAITYHYDISLSFLWAFRLVHVGEEPTFFPRPPYKESYLLRFLKKSAYHLHVESASSKYSGSL